MFHKDRFIVEDWFGPFEGWTSGQRWNGWACPCFEFDTAMQMVEAWNAQAGEGEAYQARYEAGADTFYFRDGDLEEWDGFQAQMIEAEGQTRKVYPIGAFCWIWDIA